MWNDSLCYFRIRVLGYISWTSENGYLENQMISSPQFWLSTVYSNSKLQQLSFYHVIFSIVREGRDFFKVNREVLGVEFIRPSRTRWYKPSWWCVWRDGRELARRGSRHRSCGNGNRCWLSTHVRTPWRHIREVLELELLRLTRTRWYKHSRWCVWRDGRELARRRSLLKRA